MTADKALLQDVAQELWNTTKKLRPGLPKIVRSQLVLKALMTIGDLQDQLQASMILGIIADQDPDDAPAGDSKAVEATSETAAASNEDARSTSRSVRKRSAAR
ncbi:MAG: TIGR03894 family protein [Synechococcus sp.]